ncbi:MAG TPA: hypothetical protein VLF94_01570 [Chlamydiales bacterium]|nr:hypothetical protein [Chlamydiales bacterium]
MSLEICECPPISPNQELIEIESVRQVPRGLGAVPDSIQIPPASPKPHIIKRVAVSLGLIFFHILTSTIQFYNWILKNIFGYTNRQKMLYHQLHDVATEGDADKIGDFLMEHADDASAAGFLFGEFFSLPLLHGHMTEILKGANVCLCRDNGFFCKRWREHPDAYPRISSHPSQDKKCHAIGNFLFWLDASGNTRFQLEKSPFRGFLSKVDHVIDYLRYKRDNEQQGVTGASGHTENHCLTFAIDPSDYLARKNSLLSNID